jgi:hypothetical protein
MSQDGTRSSPQLRCSLEQNWCGVPLHWRFPRGFRDAVRTVDRAQRSKPCHSWILLAPLPPELSSSVPPVRTLVDRRLAASFRDTGDSLLESTLDFISRVITIYTTVWYVCQRLFAPDFDRLPHRPLCHLYNGSRPLSTTKKLRPIPTWSRPFLSTLKMYAEPS